MIERFFFGGITPKGFSTQLTQMISGKEYYTYILKGGPGTRSVIWLLRHALTPCRPRESITCSALAKKALR